jgi:hypothetical protein
MRPRKQEGKFESTGRFEDTRSTIVSLCIPWAAAACCMLHAACCMLQSMLELISALRY